MPAEKHSAASSGVFNYSLLSAGFQPVSPQGAGIEPTALVCSTTAILEWFLFKEIALSMAFLFFLCVRQY